MINFIILAYNPNYIKLANLEKLIDQINRKQNIPVYFIEHNDDSAFPIYAVRQFDEMEDD